MKADKRAIAMGAEDIHINNVDPTYRGVVVINHKSLQVISVAVFNGVMHYGILGTDGGEYILGWIPAVLCIIE